MKKLKFIMKTIIIMLIAIGVNYSTVKIKQS